MNSNDVIRDTRVVHVRELKAEVARLKSELSAALDELGAWRAHFDLAVLAARDAAAADPKMKCLLFMFIVLAFALF